jgi:hypothetical protein
MQSCFEQDLNQASCRLVRLVPGPFGNIDQRILGRSISAEIALHSREFGEVTLENAAMKKLAAQFEWRAVGIYASGRITGKPGISRHRQISPILVAQFANCRAIFHLRQLK